MSDRAREWRMGRPVRGQNKKRSGHNCCIGKLSITVKSCENAMFSCSGILFRACGRHIFRVAAFFLLLAGVAHPADGDASRQAQPQAGRDGAVISPQSVRARINAGGPEDWPENSGLSTPSAASAGVQPPADGGAGGTPGATGHHDDAQRIAVSGQGASGNISKSNMGLDAGVKDEEDKAAPPERETVYVDEQGNPVDKPLDPEKMLADARKLMEDGKYDEAVPLLDQIRQIPGISRKMQEDVLYDISDSMWARYADNPVAGFEPIVSSTNEAMNANLRSPRVPEALLRLGLANARVGNLTDASGYMVALYRRFPDYPGVAQGFTSLGEEQLKKGLDHDAEKSFGVVLDKYPESPHLRTASVGLSHALHGQKKFDKAQVILDFISKRWPRYYIEDPDFLLLQADNDEKGGRVGSALDLYWLYLNLDPKRRGNDDLMLRMADMYWKAGNQSAADFIYHDLESGYPGSRAANVAGMRLAEKGIYDSPIDYRTMSGVFDRAGQGSMWKVYKNLAESSGKTPEGVLARLKMAMWLLWDKKYTEAMGKAAEFIDDYPEDANAAQAREVIWQAFRKELDNSLSERNYGRILILWNGFPLVRERYGNMDAPLRYALAQGWRERGDESRAFDLLAEFLKSPMDPQYGELAFTEFFNSYLKSGAWEKILDLGKLVSGWKLKPELRDQLDYAMALSAQNLNLGGTAIEMWRQLAARPEIPLYQRAYANYFLARDAENRRDIWGAYAANKKVIEMFTQLQEERSDKADPRRIRESVAALMDICEVGNRIPEALQWVDRYAAYADENSPEFPGLRFREARLRRKLGDMNRAQAILEDIIRRFPGNPFAQAAAAELRTFEVSRDLQNYLPAAGDGNAAAGQQEQNRS